MIETKWSSTKFQYVKGSLSSLEDTNWSSMVPLNHGLKFNMSILPSTLQPCSELWGSASMNLKDLWLLDIFIDVMKINNFLKNLDPNWLGIQGASCGFQLQRGSLGFHYNRWLFAHWRLAANRGTSSAYAPQKVDVAKVKVGKISSRELTAKGTWDFLPALEKEKHWTKQTTNFFWVVPAV